MKHTLLVLVVYQSPTEMGLLATPNGDLDRFWRIISGLISSCCRPGWLIFSISCLIFRTWLWIAMPSSFLLLLLKFFICSIIGIERIPPHTNLSKLYAFVYLNIYWCFHIYTWWEWVGKVHMICSWIVM